MTFGFGFGHGGGGFGHGGGGFEAGFIIDPFGIGLHPLRPPCHQEWKPISVELCPVQEAAKFAVSEHCRKEDDYLVYKLTYEAWVKHLICGSQQYRLLIKAADCVGRIDCYEAIVTQKRTLCNQRAHFVLVSFNIIGRPKC